VTSFFIPRGIFIAVSDYLDYPSITSTELNFEPLVVFPAVTFCNLNRIHCINLLREALSEDRSEEEGLILEGLFYTTGCREQMCNKLSLAVPDIKGDDDAYDDLLTIIRMGQLK